MIFFFLDMQVRSLHLLSGVKTITPIFRSAVHVLAIANVPTCQHVNFHDQVPTRNNHR